MIIIKEQRLALTIEQKEALKEVGFSVADEEKRFRTAFDKQKLAIQGELLTQQQEHWCELAKDLIAAERDIEKKAKILLFYKSNLERQIKKVNELAEENQNQDMLKSNLIEFYEEQLAVTKSAIYKVKLDAAVRYLYKVTGGKENYLGQYGKYVKSYGPGMKAYVDSLNKELRKKPKGFNFLFFHSNKRKAYLALKKQYFEALCMLYIEKFYCDSCDISRLFADDLLLNKKPRIKCGQRIEDFDNGLVDYRLIINGTRRGLNASKEKYLVNTSNMMNALGGGAPTQQRKECTPQETCQKRRPSRRHSISAFFGKKARDIFISLDPRFRGDDRAYLDPWECSTNCVTGNHNSTLIRPSK
ncbi:MAG: hypothetical protein KKA99_02655 [Gammaproteobacteria bacterium]|nr:hypothetical protein [Gammaproteobacteria bacterium]